jgi:hypothetical protein
MVPLRDPIRRRFVGSIASLRSALSPSVCQSQVLLKLITIVFMLANDIFLRKNITNRIQGYTL